MPKRLVLQVIKLHHIQLMVCQKKALKFFRGAKIKLKFDEGFLKQNKKTSHHKNVLNVYFVYEIDLWPNDLNTEFILGSFLFRAVKLTKNTDPYKYSDSGYGVGFDAYEFCFHC